MINDAPILAGVVGWPIRHSLSPFIHTYWASRTGVNGVYLPHEIPPDYDNFARSMDGLKNAGFVGVNVTLPHKEHALRYASTISDEAKRAGAANMLSFRKTNVHADNSDIYGFAQSLRPKLNSSAPPSEALVLGAGGAARGILIAIKQLGVKRINVCNRTHERAQAVARKVSAKAILWEERDEAAKDADIIVNTTSLGMTGSPPLELELQGIKPKAVVADIVYNPLETPLLAKARATGHVGIDGLDMLMHQAAPGFHQWFGAEAVVDHDLRELLIRELTNPKASEEDD